MQYFLDEGFTHIIIEFPSPFGTIFQEESSKFVVSDIVSTHGILSAVFPICRSVDVPARTQIVPRQVSMCKYCKRSWLMLLQKSGKCFRAFIQPNPNTSLL
jgi:hypothetical protein